MIRAFKTKEVILYSTPTCGWCKTAKKYFMEKKVRFREIDVTRDRKAAKEMVKISGQRGVPVISINQQVVVGFDQHQINHLLGLQ